MVVFAVQTDNSLKIESFFLSMHERLQQPDFIRRPFRGAVRNTRMGGVRIIEVEPLYPRFLFMMFSFFFFMSTAIIYSVGFSTFATVLFVIGAVMSFVVSMFYTPFFYQCVLWLQLYRLTGEAHMVRRADAVVLRRALYGRS